MRALWDRSFVPAPLGILCLVVVVILPVILAVPVIGWLVARRGALLE